MSSKNLAYNILRVDVASVVREVSQKSQWKGNILAPGSINCSTTFLQICLPTVFSERALPLHILKLPGRPEQGPLSVLGKRSVQHPSPQKYPFPLYIWRR